MTVGSSRASITGEVCAVVESPELLINSQIERLSPLVKESLNKMRSLEKKAEDFGRILELGENKKAKKLLFLKRGLAKELDETKHLRAEISAIYKEALLLMKEKMQSVETSQKKGWEVGYGQYEETWRIWKASSAAHIEGCRLLIDRVEEEIANIHPHILSMILGHQG